VGQGFARVGATDPRFNAFGKTEFRLARQLRSYKKFDKPAKRVKPLPVCVVIAILETGARASSDRTMMLADMTCVAFFFCLRPGEYTGTVTDDQAFSLDDITLFLNTRQLSLRDSSDHDLLAATHVNYCFTRQKNMNDGQVIAHARSDHRRCCPVLATIRMVLYHRASFKKFNRPFTSSVKLASYYSATGKNIPLAASAFTDVIRLHASSLRSMTGVHPKEFTARSLRAGGAMALLSGGCDRDIIKLLGRWKSDAMMDYLHEQSLPIFKRLSSLMFNNGHHSFLPTETVPIFD